MAKSDDMKVMVQEAVVENNIGTNDINALAKAIGEENATDAEKLLLAIIMAKELHRPLTYDIIGKILGGPDKAVSKVGVLKMEQRAIKKLQAAAKKAGLSKDDMSD